ncbi:MAG: DUF2199 domain-containing protein [Polyangiales bacterium]
MDFTENEREEFACNCGCGHRYLVSRGTIRAGGESARFVVIPTRDGAERVWWSAIEVDPAKPRWVLTRTWLQGGGYRSQVVDAAKSPVGAVEPFASRPEEAIPRADVVGDAPLRTRLFVLHDALVDKHPAAALHFDPERGRDFSFQMPDCVHALPPARRSRRNQQNFAELGARRFVRALLPIPVSDGDELRIGVWVEVEPAEFTALLRVWEDEAAYLATRLRGPVENSLALVGHDVRGERVSLAPRTASQCLFVAGADSPWLEGLLCTGIAARDLPALLDEIHLGMLKRRGATLH